MGYTRDTSIVCVICGVGLNEIYMLYEDEYPVFHGPVEYTLSRLVRETKGNTYLEVSI